MRKTIFFKKICTESQMSDQKCRKKEKTPHKNGAHGSIYNRKMHLGAKIYYRIKAQKKKNAIWRFFDAILSNDLLL